MIVQNIVSLQQKKFHEAHLFLRVQNRLRKIVRGFNTRVNSFRGQFLEGIIGRP